MIAPSTVQRQLPIRAPVFRPTVGLDGAKHLLDLNEDYILDLVADRKLSFAWDIGLGEERREVRILRDSIDHYIAHGSLPYPFTEEGAVSMLLPPGLCQRQWLTNPEIQRAFNCVSDHTLHLVAAHELALFPGTDYRRGPTGSALITLTSFRRFLHLRRLP